MLGGFEGGIWFLLSKCCCKRIFTLNLCGACLKCMIFLITFKFDYFQNKSRGFDCVTLSYSLIYKNQSGSPHTKSVSVYQSTTLAIYDTDKMHDVCFV